MEKVDRKWKIQAQVMIRVHTTAAYVAVPCTNEELFREIFRLHHGVQALYL